MKTKNEWLDDMELRLKRALLDVMDLPEEEGKLFLQQELRSHLEDVSGEASKLAYLNSLKERFPQARISLFTANIQDAVRGRAESLGVEFIAKPITEDPRCVFADSITAPTIAPNPTTTALTSTTRVVAIRSISTIFVSGG